jgi:hypothetical protein
VHVVGLVGRVGDEPVEQPVVIGDGEVDLVVAVDGRVLEVVLGQVGDELPDVLERVVLVGGKVGRCPSVC